MFRRGSRAQAAMEYLTTYGWAILVVMVVGVAMWRLGIFNMGYSSMTSSGFATIKPQLSGTGLSASGAFTGVFTNTLGTQIKLLSVVINNTSTGTACTGNNPSTGTEISRSNPLIVSQGDNFVVVADGCGGTTASQDNYMLTVYLQYSISIGDATTEHIEFGNLRGPYE